jgi:hypothetical protein
MKPACSTIIQSLMALIDIRPRDQDAREPGITVQVEFDRSDKLMSHGENVPRRISGTADDLAECDAVSTCASDNDSVVLFDSSTPQSTFVCGSSVVFRNLRPEILAEDVDQWVKSTGVRGEINCPCFEVVHSTGRIECFNFGFCTVRLSAPEEAVLLNFLLHSTGLDETLCLQPCDERITRTPTPVSC